MWHLPAFYNMVPGRSPALCTFGDTILESPVLKQFLGAFWGFLADTESFWIHLWKGNSKFGKVLEIGVWWRPHQLSSVESTSVILLWHSSPTITELENGDGKRPEDKVSGGRGLGGRQNSCGSTIPQRWHRFPKELQHDIGRGGGKYFLVYSHSAARCRANWFIYRTPPTL